MGVILLNGLTEVTSVGFYSDINSAAQVNFFTSSDAGGLPKTLSSEAVTVDACTLIATDLMN